MNNIRGHHYPLILTHMAGIENITATVDGFNSEAPIIGIVRNWAEQLGGKVEARDPNDKDETENIPLDPQEQYGLDASNY